MWTLVAILTSVLTLLTPATQGQNPYATEFEEARSETSSPLQLEILADDVITAQEYDTATHAFLGCMQDAGYEVTTERDPLMPALYQFIWNYPDATPGVEVPQSAWAAYDEQFNSCYVEWALQVHMLYSSVTYFPNNEDVYDANLSCLLADKLVPEDFDHEALERAAMTGDWGDNVNPGTMEFSLCLVNPFKIGLTAVASPQATP